MKTDAIHPFIPPAWQKADTAPQTETGAAGFGEVLKQTLHDVNNLQVKADEAAALLAAGKAEDVHQVMIAVEQANLAMQLTVTVRNKAVEAYQEIARMQI